MATLRRIKKGKSGLQLLLGGLRRVRESIARLKPVGEHLFASCQRMHLGPYMKGQDSSRDLYVGPMVDIIVTAPRSSNKWGGTQAPACTPYHRTHVRPRGGLVSGGCSPMPMPRVRRSIDRPCPKSRRLAVLSHLPLRMENLEHRWAELRSGNPRGNPCTRDEWSAAGARQLIPSRCGSSIVKVLTEPN